MHLQGKEAISVVTQRSTRTLLATSIVVWAAKYFNIPVADMEVFGETLPIGVFTIGAPIILTVQLVNHCMHWYGDYLSFQSWNVSDGVNKPSLFDDEAVIVPKLNGVLELAEHLKEHFSKSSESDRTVSVDMLGKLAKQVDEIKVSAIRLNSFAGIYLYVWQMAFPIVVAFIAIIYPTPLFENTKKCEALCLSILDCQSD